MSNHSTVDLETVLVSQSRGTIAVAKAMLQSAGIPFVVIGEGMWPLSRIKLAADSVEIQVPQEKADPATALLKGLRPSSQT